MIANSVSVSMTTANDSNSNVLQETIDARLDCMFNLWPYANDGNTFSIKSENKGSIAICYEREVTNNQRIGFDIDSSGYWLISGDTKGYINVWNLWEANESKPKIRMKHPYKECSSVNNAIFHPFEKYFVTTCGERVYPPRKNRFLLSTQQDCSDSSSSDDSDNGSDGNTPTQRRKSLYETNVNDMLLWKFI